MEYPVVLGDREVGSCAMEDLGLYWSLTCSCEVLSDLVERLYCGTRRLGVLERKGDRLVLHRRISKTSCPELPPANGVFSLQPMELPQSWKGEIRGCHLRGVRVGDLLLFPYSAEQPCPCEPLFCLFEISDGFWRIPIKD